MVDIYFFFLPFQKEKKTGTCIKKFNYGIEIKLMFFIIFCKKIEKWDFVKML